MSSSTYTPSGAAALHFRVEEEDREQSTKAAPPHLQIAPLIPFITHALRSTKYRLVLALIIVPTPTDGPTLNFWPSSSEASSPRLAGGRGPGSRWLLYTCILANHESLLTSLEGQPPDSERVVPQIRSFVKRFGTQRICTASELHSKWHRVIPKTYQAVVHTSRNYNGVVLFVIKLVLSPFNVNILADYEAFI